MTDVIVIRNPVQTVNVTFQAPQRVNVVVPTTVSTTSTSQEIVNLQEILGIVGPAGPTGPTGESAAVEVYDLVNVSSWTQTHTFAHRPSVTVLDNGTSSVNMEIIYPTATSVHLQFPTPFTGQVVLQ